MWWNVVDVLKIRKGLQIIKKFYIKKFSYKKVSNVKDIRYGNLKICTIYNSVIFVHIKFYLIK